MPQPPASLPPAHLTMLLTHRAMVRDIGCVAAAADGLAREPAAARTAALQAYIDRLFIVIEHHHGGEDAYLWPLLRERGGDREALALLTEEHEKLSDALHSWYDVSRRLPEGASPAADLADRSRTLRGLLIEHAGDEERELTGRLAPVLDDVAWKGFATYMRRTAPLWTLRFMPAWLASVAEPHERRGVPAGPVARLFGPWLARSRQAAFGAATAGADPAV